MFGNKGTDGLLYADRTPLPNYYELRHNYALDYDEDFIRHLQELIRHDQAMFEEPEGWNTAPAISAPLLNNFDKLWQELSSTYEHELGMLAYKPIPPANEIKASMSGFIDFLKSNIE